jgi:hypothetical protein
MALKRWLYKGQRPTVTVGRLFIRQEYSRIIC